MYLKWFGAILIICACGGFALMMKFSHQKEVNLVKQVIRLLDFMECQLRYKMPALSELLRQCAQETNGVLQTLFIQIADKLDQQLYPDVKGCMNELLEENKMISPVAKECLQILSDVLGRFDLDGQLQGLQSVRQECKNKLQSITEQAQSHLRSYQMLGICGGAALVILLM